MNQPALGLKVAELRQSKGLTQEQLAEKCEVSPRTIQRIESGEVDPRAYTMQCLRAALDFDFGDGTGQYDNLWLALMHLSSATLSLIIPIVLWSWKKDESRKMDVHGRLVLNFQVTMTLLMFVFAACMITGLVAMPIILGQTLGERYVLMSVTIALFMPVPVLLTGLYCTVMGVLNTVRALSDKPVHYPLSIPFVR
jgi:uncharacterized Tic20 family protein/DNA-binding XRE family transcriptional regulator